MSSFIETIYRAPGAAVERIYAIPRRLGAASSDSNLLALYQPDWKEIGQLDASQGQLRLDPRYSHLASAIQSLPSGQCLHLSAGGQLA